MPGNTDPIYTRVGDVTTNATTGMGQLVTAAANDYIESLKFRGKIDEILLKGAGASDEKITASKLANLKKVESVAKGVYESQSDALKKLDAQKEKSVQNEKSLLDDITQATVGVSLTDYAAKRKKNAEDTKDLRATVESNRKIYEAASHEREEAERQADADAASKKRDDAKKANDEAKKRAEQFAKEELAAHIESLRLDLEYRKQIAKEALDNDKLSYDERIKAAQEYRTASIALINFEQSQSNNKGPEAQRKAEKIAMKANHDLAIELAKDNQKVADDTYEHNKKLRDQEYQDAVKLSQRKQQLVVDSVDAESSKQALQVQLEYEKKIRNSSGEQRIQYEKELSDKLGAIANEGELKKTEYLILQLKTQAALLKAYGITSIDLTKQIADAEKKASEARVKQLKDEKIGYVDLNKAFSEFDQKKIDGLDVAMKFEEQASKLITGLSDARYDREKNRIQENINLIEKKRAADIDAINHSSRSEQDKAAAIVRVNATADAKKQQQELRQRQADEKKARFDKAVTIMNIVLNTALAAIKAYANNRQ